VRYATHSPPFFKEGRLDEANAAYSRGGSSRAGPDFAGFLLVFQTIDYLAPQINVQYVKELKPNG
jgi:hypothetical protein